MNKINKIIFVGLIISGTFSLLGFLGFILEIKSLMGPEFVGMYFGVLFGLFAITSFIYGTFMYLIGRMDDYWRSLYPINLGLTLLGVAMWQYNLNMPAMLILATFILAFVITFIIYKTNATKSRWLVITLIGVSFITQYYCKVVFWDTIIIGVIFVGLPLVIRSRKRNGIPNLQNL